MAVQPITLVRADGSTTVLNEHGDPVVERYLSMPKAYAAEMVSQINDRGHYDGIFTGRSDLVFVDLGANLGIVSLYAAPCCRRVVAVEAEPKTSEVMRRLCQPFQQIEAVSRAIGPRSGFMSLSVNERNWTCHTAVNPIAGYPVKRVAASTFPDFCREQGLEGIDVCKVDIEGAEMASFTEDIIRAAGVKRWYVEVHQTPGTDRQDNTLAMKLRLERCGFSVSVPRKFTLITAP